MNIFIFVSQEWLLITFLFALIAALVAVTRKNNGLPIFASELVTLMNQEKAVLIDVRSANDFNQGHMLELYVCMYMYTYTNSRGITVSTNES